MERDSFTHPAGGDGIETHRAELVREVEEVHPPRRWGWD